MVDFEVCRGAVIALRPIRPSDLAVLEKLHLDLFPIRYEPDFFHNVVNGNDIVSWGAVDHSRPDGQSDKLIGFVTAKVVSAADSEIEDLVKVDSSRNGHTLVYILTLGVVNSYRNMGIGSSLIYEVVKYASSISSCRAVYLHVISYNITAMHLYKKMSFQCLQRLYNFYFINGRHYDAFLFLYYVNGGRSPCSPIEIMMFAVGYVSRGFNSMVTKFWRFQERKISKWMKCKESFCESV